MGVIRKSSNRPLVNLAFLLFVLITSTALAEASVGSSLAFFVNAANVSDTFEIEVEEYRMSPTFTYQKFASIPYPRAF